jgi:glycosyltransferase involved in cell wall biosynthesis
LKVLFVGNYLQNAGKNIGATYEIADQLTQRGFETKFTSNKVNKISRLLDILGTIFFHQSEYQVAQVDVFSGPAFIWAFLSIKLLIFLNKPVILTLHGGNLPEFARHNPRLVKRVLNRATLVTTPSRYLLDALRKYCHDIILIPNAIDLKNYIYRDRSILQPKYIWLRAFHKIYNPELAIDVLDLMRNDYPQSRLIMVGPDKNDGSLQKCQEKLAELRLEALVEFLGGIPKLEVPTWLNKADLFINTTNIDNTPVSVLEGMASGLCIVSTNVGGIPYMLKDGYDALLVPPNDPKAMAGALRRLLNEQGLAQKLSSNARKKAEQYDWSKVIPIWEALFNQVAGSSKI